MVIAGGKGRGGGAAASVVNCVGRTASSDTAPHAGTATGAATGTTTAGAAEATTGSATGAAAGGPAAGHASGPGATAGQAINRAPTPVVGHADPRRFNHMGILSVAPSTRGNLCPTHIRLNRTFGIATRIFVRNHAGTNTAISMHGAHNARGTHFPVAYAGPNLSH